MIPLRFPANYVGGMPRISSISPAWNGIVRATNFSALRFWNLGLTSSSCASNFTSFVLPRLYAPGIIRPASFSALYFWSLGLIISESHNRFGDSSTCEFRNASLAYKVSLIPLSFASGISETKIFASLEACKNQVSLNILFTTSI
jgi:hypothetical protein